jgi:hypothetical protein
MASSHEVAKGYSHGRKPTSFDRAPIALYSGRGAGGEGVTLCFDWYFDREFNDHPRFRSVNKPLNLR